MDARDRTTVIGFAALSAWLISLLTGHVLGGAIHGLLVLGVLAVPWQGRGGRV